MDWLSRGSYLGGTMPRAHCVTEETSLTPCEGVGMDGHCVLHICATVCSTPSPRLRACDNGHLPGCSRPQWHAQAQAWCCFSGPPVCPGYGQEAGKRRRACSTASYRGAALRVGPWPTQWGGSGWKGRAQRGRQMWGNRGKKALGWVLWYFFFSFWRFLHQTHRYVCAKQILYHWDTTFYFLVVMLKVQQTYNCTIAELFFILWSNKMFRFCGPWSISEFPQISTTPSSPQSQAMHM